MRIALVQGRVKSDRPAENLEYVKAVLKSRDVAEADLVVFPALILSGRLGPTARSRPGLAGQQKKVWAEFLEISAQHPRAALASSALDFRSDGTVGERVFAVREGRELFSRAAGELEGATQWELAGRRLSLWTGDETQPPRAAGPVDILITLRDHLFQGEPYTPPFPGPAEAWRLNVSAVGGQGPRLLEGATWVFDPAGRLKGWAHGFDNTVIILDPEAKNLPDLEPRPIRPPLEVLRRALVTGLADYIRSTGCGRVLLGLSGGIDSAVVAALAVEAVGPANVLGVAMPSEFNAPESLSLARQLAGNLGIAFLTLPIEQLRESFARSFLLCPPADEKAAGLAAENIQARIRAVLLMYMANRENRLLLATGNKSEAAMGYSTLYGDTCGAIAPIGDLYKVRVYDLARHLNRDGERIPEGIITRAPSAELRCGQKDEDSLPPYPLLDDILHRHLEGGQSGSQVTKEGGHSALTVAWVLSTLKKTAFKRSQEPFCLHVSTHPLAGLDWW